MSWSIRLVNERDAPPVSDQPLVRLISWRVLRSTRGEFHIAAQLENGPLRFSSALASVDFAAGLATTSSGRKYQFLRPPEEDQVVCETLWGHAVGSGLIDFEDVSVLWWQSIMHGPDLFPGLGMPAFPASPDAA